MTTARDFYIALLLDQRILQHKFTSLGIWYPKGGRITQNANRTMKRKNVTTKRAVCVLLMAHIMLQVL